MENYIYVNDQFNHHVLELRFPGDGFAFVLI